MRPIRYVFVLVPVTIVSFATSVARPANCVLCDPDRQIYSLFPEATRYRALTGRVDEKNRKSIERFLGEKLAFSDLGKTSMCIAFRDDAPLGFVQARSEVGRYGAIQLVWAIDLDLRVKEFRIQRSREKETPRLRRKEFHDKVRGKGWRELRSCLNEVRASQTPELSDAARKAREIEIKALISGVKTLLTVEHAFRGTLGFRLVGNVHRFFPGTVKVAGIRDPLGGNALAVVEKELGSRPAVIEKETFTALRSVDGEGGTRGVVILTSRGNDLTGPEVWWSVSPDGRIHDVLTRSEVRQEIRNVLESLRGQRLKNLQEKPEGSMVVRCAAEILAVLSAHDIGSRN